MQGCRPQGFPGARIGRISLLALALLLVGGVPVGGEEEPHGIAVLPTRAAPVFDSVASGFETWLHYRLQAADIEVLDPSLVAAGLEQLPPGKPVLTGTDALPAAEHSGAAMLLISELRFDEGQAGVRLRLYDGTDGALITASPGDGRLGELGSLAHDALAAMLERLGLSTGDAGDAKAPRLADFSALARAKRWLDGDEPVSAWRALGSVYDPAADLMRGEIKALVAASTDPATRSRFANVSGQRDKDWLRVRAAIPRASEPGVLIAAGDAAVARNEPARAINFYAKAVEMAPGDYEAQMGYATTLASASRDDEARAAYQSAIEIDPDDPRPHRGLAALESIAASARAQHLVRAGAIHADQLDPEQATSAYEEATKLDGGIVAQAYRNVALLNQRLGNNGEALLGFEQSFQVGSRDPEVFLGLGETRAATGDVDGATEAFRGLLAMRGDDPRALAGLGRTLADGGQDEEAADQLERALEISPGDVKARSALAGIHRRAGRGAAALEVLDPTLLPDGVLPLDRAELLRQAAEVHTETGDFSGAELALGQAVALAPEEVPLHTALARLHEAKGDGSGAQQALARVAALKGLEIASAARGGAGEGTREVEAADSRTFVQLVSTFPEHHPKQGRPLGRVLMLPVSEELDLEGRIRRWLWPLRPDLEAIELELMGAMAERFEIDGLVRIPENLSGQISELAAFSTEREAIATVNELLESDAVFVGRVSPARLPSDNILSPERLALEVRLLGGRTSDGVFILANTMRLPDGGGSLVTWNYRVALPYLMILLGIGYPFYRGWGTIVVKLDYDGKNAKGFFNIKITRRPGKAKTSKAPAGSITKHRKYQNKTRTWSRRQKAMADRETRFPFLAARTWYVQVEGLLQSSSGQEVIGNYLEERKLQLGRGETLEVAFDFNPKEAPIEVSVSTGEEAEGQPEVNAATALRGQPDTIRYLRNGSALFHVLDGDHVVVLGYEDRIFEQQVLIQNLVGAGLVFNLKDDTSAVFTGCPDAVEPYLQGDLTTASQALDRAGQTEIANLLRAEYHRERGEAGDAARYFEAAGHMETAAELAAESDDTSLSATLFEQAGDLGKAADQYREGGDLARAAAAYEEAYDYESAIDCYREAGNQVKVMDLLEKTGAFYDAAEVAFEAGDSERAARNLQQVDLRDPQYVDACRMLSEVFSEQGEHELAVHKMNEAVSVAGDDAAPLELLDTYVDLLSRADENDRAIEICETIRRRDFAYPGVAEKLETLRAKTATEAEGARTIAAPAPSGAAPPSESRYEILGEIGRGGMGVVFRARDKRLGRVIALKRLPENLRENETAVQLFLREARAAAALNHPNIVTLFDADQEDGNYYITMEFLEGMGLDTILTKRGKLSARDSARLGVQIAKGLAFAHERKIVHRDIKTSNLFFTNDKVVKIMDFGLAKMMEEVRRAATVIGGTPYYMAPEQAIGKGVDHRADLYAFGVTLFELMTGTVPFKEGDITYHHRHTPPPDPRSLVEGIPDGLAEMILSLLEKQPDARPGSAADVGALLAEVIAG